MEPGIQGLHKLGNGHLLPGTHQPFSNSIISADRSTRLTLKEIRVMGPQAKLHISDLEVERMKLCEISKKLEDCRNSIQSVSLSLALVG